MKLTNSILRRLIEEALEPLEEEGEIEELYPESGPGGPFRKAFEKDHVAKDKLRDILEKWEVTEYESDIHRWQQYHDDIAALVEEEEI